VAPVSSDRMATDVTDATFQSEVIDASFHRPVVVDLWAEWCGPCRTLGPIIEKVVDDTEGKVTLVKVDVDANPRTAAAFGVQSIPLVVAVKDGRPVDGFLGAQPEHAVREFVARLLPTEEEEQVAELVETHDEASLRQALELDPDNAEAIAALAELLVEEGRGEEALEVLAKVPETERTRTLAARARLGTTPTDGHSARLDALLDAVKVDEQARQEFLDLLEVMGPDDPRVPEYRKRLASRLF
jgi:putative thioredoxin